METILIIMNFIAIAIIVYSLNKTIRILEGKVEILVSERKAEKKESKPATPEINVISDCPPGFRLMLDDFCEYCGDFEAEVHSIECMNTGDANTKTTNYIHCVNHPYCKRVNEFYKKLQMREVDDGEV